MVAPNVLAVGETAAAETGPAWPRPTSTSVTSRAVHAGRLRIVGVTSE